MTQEVVNVGANADDGTGDSLYEAGNKINSNFTELFAKNAVKADIKFFGNNITSRLSNADIFVHPSGTGHVVFPGIRFNDNNIEVLNSNDDIKISASGSGKVTIAGLGFSGTTISAPDSSSVNFNENLIVDGDYTTADGFTFTGAQTFATGTAIGNLTLANGSITDSSGAISFGNENLTTSGTLNAGDNSQFGNLDLSDGLIVNYLGGSIDFGNENLSTTGTLSAATGSQFGNLDFLNGTINDSSGAISFGDENLSTTATSMAINSTLTAANGSITDSTGALSFGDDNLSTTGTLTVDGLSTFGSMSVSGATSFADSITVDNLTFNDNIISTSSNADLRLTPGGTGVVNVSNLTIDSSLNFSDNVLKVTTSNADFDLAGSGTGSVQINNIDLNSGTIDNVVIGANEPAAGNFTQPITYTSLVIPDKITFSGNTMSSNRSNDNLEFAANGSGKVIVNEFSLPNSDGDTGAFLRTDGSKALSFFVNSISFSESTIVDNQQTIGFSSKTLIDANTATGRHEQIQAAATVIDEFTQSKYDSAWYLVLSRNKAADSAIEYQFQKHVIAQGTNDGSTFDSFSGSSQIIRSSANDKAPELASDVRAAVSNVRLTGRAGLLADSSVSTDNAVSYFRIGLGDNDSSGTQAASGLAATKVVADLDSATATLDSFAVASYRGAKYFISVNNTTSNEVSSSEVLVVHNGTDAFIQEYNLVISNEESSPLATFTVDINGGNLRLRGANGTAGTCRVTMYRILLSDSESDSDGTYVDVIGATTVTQNSETTIDGLNAFISSKQGFETTEILDEFPSSKYDSAWYFTVAKDQTGGSLSFHKYSLLHGTSDDSSIQSFVTDSGVVRTEEHDVVTASTSVDDGNVQLKLTGTNDGSTTIKNHVASYRIGLGDNDSTGYTGEETDETTVAIATIGSAVANIDTFAAGANSGAKYYISAKNTDSGEVENVEAIVTHDNTNAFITTYNQFSSGTDTMLTLTADIDSGSVRLRGASTAGANTRVTAYRILLADSETAQTGTFTRTTATVTNVVSAMTTIDTFSASSVDAAHYIIVGRTGVNGGCVTEATVVTDGSDAYVTQYGEVSMKTQHETAHLTLQASLSSGTVTLQASATNAAGGGVNTAVTVYRIDLKAPTGTPFDEIDSFAHSSEQAANYIVVTKQSDNKSSIDEISVVSDGTDAYHVQHGINTDSASTDLINFTTAVDSGNVKLRAELVDHQQTATVNAFKIPLNRPTGNPTSVATLDTFDKTTHRSAAYFITISDSNSGSLGNYETVEARVTHDGTTPYVSIFGRTNTTTGDLVTFSSDIDGDNVRLRGTISSTNAHKVTVVRRLINL